MHFHNYTLNYDNLDYCKPILTLKYDLNSANQALYDTYFI